MGEISGNYCGGDFLVWAPMGQSWSMTEGIGIIQGGWIHMVYVCWMIILQIGNQLFSPCLWCLLMSFQYVSKDLTRSKCWCFILWVLEKESAWKKNEAGTREAEPKEKPTIGDTGHPRQLSNRWTDLVTCPTDGFRLVDIYLDYSSSCCHPNSLSWYNHH